MNLDPDYRPIVAARVHTLTPEQSAAINAAEAAAVEAAAVFRSNPHALTRRRWRPAAVLPALERLERACADMETALRGKPWPSAPLWDRWHDVARRATYIANSLRDEPELSPYCATWRAQHLSGLLGQLGTRIDRAVTTWHRDLFAWARCYLSIDHWLMKQPQSKRL